MIGLQVLLELLVGQLVALLELAVVGPVFLDCVIGQMHIQVLGVFSSELAGGGPNVSFFVPVALEVPINAGYQHVVPNIELPFEIEQGPLYVFLDDECPELAITVFLPPFNPDQNIINAVGY